MYGTKLWKEKQSPRVKKERKPTLRGKWESAFSGKAHGQYSKGDSCSFSHDRQVQGDLYGGQRRKGRSSSPAPNSKAKTDGGGESLQKHQATEREALQTRNDIPCRDQNCQNPSCKLWHPSVCQHYKSETGCTFGRTCFFRHVESEEKPSKKPKKGGAKGSVALLEEATQLVVSLKFPIRGIQFNVKKENWDQNTPSNSPRAPGTKFARNYPKMST